MQASLAMTRRGGIVTVAVKPASAGSLPLIVGRVLNCGAGDGNRTRIKSLGSSHSTIELHLRCGCVCSRVWGGLQVFFGGVDKFFWGD